MVVGYAVREGIRLGTRLFPKTFRTIKRADVAIHKSLYGASGGKGVRHGRDIGSIVAGTYTGLSGGTDLDAEDELSPPSSPFRKARGGYQRSNRGRYSECDRRNRYRCRPCRPKYKSMRYR